MPAAQLDALLTALAHLHGVLLDQAIRLEEVEHDGAPFDHTTAWRDLAHAVDRRRQFPITRNPSP